MIFFQVNYCSVFFPWSLNRAVAQLKSGRGWWWRALADYFIMLVQRGKSSSPYGHGKANVEALPVQVRMDGFACCNTLKIKGWFQTFSYFHAVVILFGVGVASRNRYTVIRQNYSPVGTDQMSTAPNSWLHQELCNNKGCFRSGEMLI